MGMGEPLFNLPNVLKAVDLLTAEIGISMRKLTISTVGVTPSIQKLADMDMQFTLALSLHAPDEELRRKLMPMTSRYPLNELIQTCRNYANSTKRRITFEYLMISGVNDSPENLSAMKTYLTEKAPRITEVNLLPYHRLGEGKREQLESVTGFTSAVPSDEVIDKLNSFFKAG
jgi:23S rRNA (adenine2503-C2)-methyltransferase